MFSSVLPVTPSVCSQTVKGLFELTSAAVKGPQPQPVQYIASGTSEIQRHCQVCLARHGEQLTQTLIVHLLKTRFFWMFQGKWGGTTLQSVTNTKLSKRGFWHFHENRLNKMIQTIPHKL